MRKSGKVRENSPQKVRESQGILSGHVSGNPDMGMKGDEWVKDTVFLPLVIHLQNIRLLKGPLYHKSLLLIRLLQISTQIQSSFFLSVS